MEIGEGSPSEGEGGVLPVWDGWIESMRRRRRR